MHQVCLLELFNMAASDLLLRSKLTMICCLPRTVSLLSIVAVDFWVSGHRQTGGVVSGSTGRVMNATGASAQALENGCLRFVPATKTHGDIPFATNHVSPTKFFLHSSSWIQ